MTHSQYYRLQCQVIYDWANLILLLNVTIVIRVMKNLKDGARAKDFSPFKLDNEHDESHLLQL